MQLSGLHAIRKVPLVSVTGASVPLMGPAVPLAGPPFLYRGLSLCKSPGFEELHRFMGISKNICLGWT